MQTPTTENKSYSTASIQLISNTGLVVLLVTLVFSIWKDITTVVILISILFAAIGIAKFWSHYSLNNVYYKRLLSGRRAFQGDNVKLTITVSNKKLLPLAWLDIDDKLPIELSIPKTVDEESLTNNPIISIALSSFKRAKWEYQISCTKRGCYMFGPANLSSGDIFGFYPRSMVIPESDTLIVYPRIFAIDRLELSARQPLGELKAHYRIFQDPTRTIGVREYIPGDPFNHINWKATARHLQLQVKEFEPSTTLQNIICLGVDTFIANEKNKADETFEWAISAVASISSHLVKNGAALGFFANTGLAKSNKPITVLPGTSPEHMIHILELLAKISLNSIDTLEDLINRQRRVLPWGATLIFIVSQVSQQLQIILNELSKSGYQIALFQIGDMPVETESPSYQIYKIRTYGDIREKKASLLLEKVL